MKDFTKKNTAMVDNSHLDESSNFNTEHYTFFAPTSYFYVQSGLVQKAKGIQKFLTTLQQ